MYAQIHEGEHRRLINLNHVASILFTEDGRAQIEMAHSPGTFCHETNNEEDVAQLHRDMTMLNRPSAREKSGGRMG
jgi:hypothetical protein